MCAARAGPRPGGSDQDDRERKVNPPEPDSRNERISVADPLFLLRWMRGFERPGVPSGSEDEARRMCAARAGPRPGGSDQDDRERKTNPPEPDAGDGDVSCGRSRRQAWSMRIRKLLPDRSLGEDIRDRDKQFISHIASWLSSPFCPMRSAPLAAISCGSRACGRNSSTIAVSRRLRTDRVALFERVEISRDRFRRHQARSRDISVG